MKLSSNLFATTVLLLLSHFSAHVCYIGYPRVLDCGATGQPTRITTVFPKTSNATGVVWWGEYSFGFAAKNFSYQNDTVTVFINENDDHQIIVEHTYEQAGTYSISLDMTVYHNLTIDTENPFGYCISQQVPGVLSDGTRNGEWLLIISDNGCQEEVILSSGVGGSGWKSVVAILLTAQLAAGVLSWMIV